MIISTAFSSSHFEVTIVIIFSHTIKTYQLIRIRVWQKESKYKRTIDDWRQRYTGEADMEVAINILFATILLYITLLESTNSEQSTCKYILKDIPSTCVNSTELWTIYSQKDDELPAKVINNTPGTKNNNDKCLGKEICQKNFRITARRAQFMTPLRY